MLLEMLILEIPTGNKTKVLYYYCDISAGRWLYQSEVIDKECTSKLKVASIIMRNHDDILE